jgi:hypothetical protein
MTWGPLGRSVTRTMPASIRSGSGAFHVAPAGAPRRRRGLGRLIARFVVLAALATVVAATIIVVVKSPFSSAGRSGPAGARHATALHLPPYWTVHPGETLTTISAKTGLTVAQLDAFNPNIDPTALVPGQRLNLWRHPPRPRPKPLGPRFWTVRSGDSFGLIAAKTGINIVKLEQLNRQLKPATLQPGDRVQLRK